MNLLQRVVGGVLAGILFVLALIFASVLFAVVAVLALAAWAWLLWRTRYLPRRTARAGTSGSARGAASTGTSSGTVIEGEYRVEREVRRIDDDTR